MLFEISTVLFFLYSTDYAQVIHKLCIINLSRDKKNCVEKRRFILTVYFFSTIIVLIFR